METFIEGSLERGNVVLKIIVRHPKRPFQQICQERKSRSFDRLRRPK